MVRLARAMRRVVAEVGGVSSSEKTRHRRSIINDSTRMSKWRCRIKRATARRAPIERRVRIFRTDRPRARRLRSVSVGCRRVAASTRRSAPRDGENTLVARAQTDLPRYGVARVTRTPRAISCVRAWSRAPSLLRLRRIFEARERASATTAEWSAWPAPARRRRCRCARRG